MEQDSAIKSKWCEPTSSLQGSAATITNYVKLGMLLSLLLCENNLAKTDLRKEGFILDPS